MAKDTKQNNQEPKRKSHSEYVPAPVVYECVGCKEKWEISDITAEIADAKLIGKHYTGFWFENKFMGRMTSCPNCP